MMSLPLSKKRAPRTVLDVNVWISALIWGGKPAEVLIAAENHNITIFLSEEIVQELSRVLAFPKLRKIYVAEGMRQEDLVEEVLRISRFVRGTKQVRVVWEHPADDKFIECAIAADADYLISGNKHLLKIASYKKTQILSVNEFLQILKGKASKK